MCCITNLVDHCLTVYAINKGRKLVLKYTRCEVDDFDKGQLTDNHHLARIVAYLNTLLSI